MKKMGIMQSIHLAKSYRKLDVKSRNTLQMKRLNELVQFARSNSPFYSKLYENISSPYDLKKIPTVTKPELMNSWNEWVTDKDITYDQVINFMDNKNNIGRKLVGKYNVYTTSGSTGNPLVLLSDRNATNVTNGISFCRGFACKDDFNPVMLGGYPSNLELLIGEQEIGRLHISPIIIMTGGEYLSPELRLQLENTFNCKVQTTYSCTEGGTVSCECEENHLHINDDWLIVEPVDKDNNPVEDGSISANCEEP